MTCLDTAGNSAALSGSSAVRGVWGMSIGLPKVATRCGCGMVEVDMLRVL